MDDIVLCSFFSDKHTFTQKQERDHSKNNFLRMLKRDFVNTPIKKDIKINDLVNKKYLFTKDDIFLNSLYCDINGFNKIDYLVLNKLKGDDGYNDTYFLIQLLLLESLSCFDKKTLKKDKDLIIQDIINAENNNTIFSDLYVERIVVLAWAGEIDSIKLNWIKKIINNQNADSSWFESNNPGGVFHTTALSALSLKYYLEQRVNDVWFAK